MWDDQYRAAFRAEKERAQQEMRESVEMPIFAWDIDPKMVEMARFHARMAGVENCIHFAQADALCFEPKTQIGTVFSNPPYAIRMGERKQVRELYRGLGRRLLGMENMKCYFISADEQFELAYGRRADKKRKLYNGNIQCTFYQYFR